MAQALKPWRRRLFEASAVLLLLSAFAQASIDLGFHYFSPVHRIHDIETLSSSSFLFALLGTGCAGFGKGWPRVFFLVVGLFMIFKFQSLVFA